MNKIIIYTDGASKENPGPAGAGVVFVVEDGTGSKVQGSLSWFIPSATNNQAEYTAVLLALQIIRVLSFYYVEIRSDSLLLVKQLHGEWMIKDKELKILFNGIIRIMDEMPGRITFTHIPREQNKEADTLANKAIIDFNKTLDKKEL